MFAWSAFINPGSLNYWMCLIVILLKMFRWTMIRLKARRWPWTCPRECHESLLLEWQGFARPCAKRALRYLVWKHNSSLIWLMETKACIGASNNLRRVLNYSNSFYILAIGLRGNFFLYWNLDIELQL